MDKQNFSDLQLFSALQHDDGQAMDKIYEAWWEKLFDLAYSKLGDIDAAREIVQEVLIYLWENRYQLNIEISFGSYLFKAVKYRILNYYKANSIRQSHKNQLFHLVDSVVDNHGEHSMLGKETQIEIDQAVQELPEKMQEVFKMSKVCGKSNKEIADELDISIQTVKNQLSSALRILRKSLSYLQMMVFWFLTQN